MVNGMEFHNKGVPDYEWTVPPPFPKSCLFRRKKSYTFPFPLQKALDFKQPGVHVFTEA